MFYGLGLQTLHEMELVRPQQLFPLPSVTQVFLVEAKVFVGYKCWIAITQQSSARIKKSYKSWNNILTHNYLNEMNMPTKVFVFPSPWLRSGCRTGRPGRGRSPSCCCCFCLASDVK